MNIITATGQDTFRSDVRTTENELGGRAEQLSGSLRQKGTSGASRPSGSASDTVFISEAAILLASGLLPGSAPAPAAPSAPVENQYTTYIPLGYARSAVRRVRNTAAAASIALLGPQSLSQDWAEATDRPPLRAAGASGRQAVSEVARLQNRIRNLQQKLSSLEGEKLPEQVRAAEAHSLNSQIHQTMQDINGLSQQARA